MEKDIQASERVERDTLTAMYDRYIHIQDLVFCVLETGDLEAPESDIRSGVKSSRFTKK
jgi:hypothetical protein